MESYRRALSIEQKLADHNPAVTDFRSGLAQPTTTSAICSRGPASRPRRWHRTDGRSRSSRSWPTTTPPSPTSRCQLALDPQQHRRLARARPAGPRRRWKRTGGHWRSNRSSQTERHRHPVQAQPGGDPHPHWQFALSAGQVGPGDGILSSGARDRAEARRTKTPRVTEFRRGLALAHHRIGLLQSRTGKPAAAMESYRRALAIEQKLADDNPTGTDFRNSVARTYHDLGEVQSKIGKPAEAVDSLRRALEIEQKLADENPTVTEFRHVLARTHNDLGTLQVQINQPAEALESFRSAPCSGKSWLRTTPPRPFTEMRWRAFTRTSLISTAPSAAPRCARELRPRDRDRGGPGQRQSKQRRFSWRTGPERAPSRARARGRRRRRGGGCRRPVGRRAVERLPSRTGEQWYELACCHAALAGASTIAKSGISPADGEAEAKKAMDLLRRAIAAGFHDAGAMAKEVALDPLRPRPDFRPLVTDLSMPADPFAP